ncbi:hypothetical protein J4Q44_G00088890 [Coregonus suidteri]|uniref:Uncharacterized protein n=1 Tax=Coregonus suidteri TaxID=861788 RepID=A0AAN8M5Z4_9TELE
MTYRPVESHPPANGFQSALDHTPSFSNLPIPTLLDIPSVYAANQKPSPPPCDGKEGDLRYDDDDTTPWLSPCHPILPTS